MTTGLKLFFFLAFPILLLMVVFGWLDQRRSHDLLRAELVREGRAITAAIRVAVEDALRDRRLEDLHDLVDRMSGYERILGVRVFDASGALNYQSDTLDPYPFSNHDVLERVLRDRVAERTHRHIGVEPLVTFLEPLESPAGGLLGAVQVLQFESVIAEDARASSRSIAALTATMILLTAGIIFMVTRTAIGRPVEELVASFRTVGAGNLDVRAPEEHGGELGQLAIEFNRMCERLDATRRRLIEEQDERRKAEDRLRRAEHLASLGRLAAGVAHEIGTPLNVIGGRTEALLRKLPPDDPGRRNLGIIAEQIERIATIVRGMLDFARDREPQFAPTDLSDVVRKVLDFLEDRIAESGIELDLSLPRDLPPVPADADQLQQVFLNLAVNALDAMPDGGTLSVRVARRHAREAAPGEPPRDCQLVTFADTGRGVDPEHVDRIFTPFFTTKAVGRGTGLGLSVSWGIVKEHGGWIQVESRVGLGTRVIAYFPDQASEHAGTAAEVAS